MSRARQLEREALGVPSRHVSRSRSRSRSKSKPKKTKSDARPSTAPAQARGQPWTAPSSGKENEGERLLNHHRSINRISHTGATTHELSASEKVARQADNVFRQIKKLMSGKRKLYGKKLSDAQQIFETMDKDGGGFLSHSEFGTALGRLGLGLSEKQVEEVLAVVDADGSGTVEYAEFIALLGGEDDGKVWRVHEQQGGQGAAKVDAAQWRDGLHHGKHGRMVQHVDYLEADDDAPAPSHVTHSQAPVEAVRHQHPPVHVVVPPGGGLGELSAVSHREEGPVFSEEEEVPEEEEEGGGSSIGEEMMPMTTDDLDVDSAGGELYYTMHATRYSAARGEPERHQKQEEGWLQGAVSTLYDEH